MTMTITQQIITVVVVVLGTMTTRFLPFIIFPGGKEPPAVITYLGKVLPCAVIGLLVVFCLKDVTESTHYGLPELTQYCSLWYYINGRRVHCSA